ncbi:MAG: hypothetical protein AB7I48_21680, partial [Planctomycetaceae bacterium]
MASLGRAGRPAEPEYLNRVVHEGGWASGIGLESVLSGHAGRKHVPGAPSTPWESGTAWLLSEPEPSLERR